MTGYFPTCGGNGIVVELDSLLDYGVGNGHGVVSVILGTGHRRPSILYLVFPALSNSLRSLKG